MDKHPAIQAFLAEYRDQSRKVERELREWSEPKLRELREQVGPDAYEAEFGMYPLTLIDASLIDA